MLGAAVLCLCWKAVVLYWGLLFQDGGREQPHVYDDPFVLGGFGVVSRALTSGDLNQGCTCQVHISDRALGTSSTGVSRTSLTVLSGGCGHLP